MVLVSQERHAAALQALREARASVGPRLLQRLGAIEGTRALAAYHIGFVDAYGRPCDGPGGKLLRPALCLTAARGYANAEAAVDAAVAIELVHAFSLVHDDIEDGDAERRHRPTLWVEHGVPLALNCGDFLFALARRALVDAVRPLDAERAFEALRLFDDACIAMIEGQHADLEFESRERVSRDEYLAMARGKTGALIGAALALGALSARAPLREAAILREAGVEMGIAFQAVDDMLGVWGDPAVTGKPAGADQARGKKSLPAVVAADVGLDVSAAGVRQAALAEAEIHSAEAQRLLRGASLAPGALQMLLSMIRFVLERES